MAEIETIDLKKAALEVLDEAWKEADWLDDSETTMNKINKELEALYAAGFERADDFKIDVRDIQRKMENFTKEINEDFIRLKFDIANL